jgi:hypothetical protein
MLPWVRFGEDVEGYSIKVLNEREVRAAAGILFFFAMISFLNAFLVGNFTLTKVFVVVFFSDFLIRVVINPRYAPSMILGRLVVRNQTPDYVGAPQKHFAWTIGLLLGAAMLWLLVLNDIRGPLNLVICFSCLMLLFFETAFGICLGCYLYQAITKKQAQLCPGDVCQVRVKEPIQRVSAMQWLVLVLFAGGLLLLATDYYGMKAGHESWIGISKSKPKKQAEPVIDAQSFEDEKDCTPPDAVIAMGHEARWKERHGCNTPLPDARQSLQLSDDEKTVFLADMRKMLASVQGITLALAAQDRQGMIDAAKVSGNQMARDTPMSIKQKLPPSFQAIGAPMHLSFEEFAIRAETDELPELTARLGQMMNNCMACHAAFKVN